MAKTIPKRSQNHFHFLLLFLFLLFSSRKILCTMSSLTDAMGAWTRLLLFCVTILLHYEKKRRHLNSRFTFTLSLFFLFTQWNSLVVLLFFSRFLSFFLAKILIFSFRRQYKLTIAFYLLSPENRLGEG